MLPIAGITLQENVILVKVIAGIIIMRVLKLNFKCNDCELIFPVKAELRKHNKLNHKDSTPECKKDKNGTCQFQDCWFIHENEKRNDGKNCWTNS